MLYVLYFLAAIGALFIFGALVRFIGLKRLSVGVEFYRAELKESSEAHLANDSRPVLQDGRVNDGRDSGRYLHG